MDYPLTAHRLCAQLRLAKGHQPGRVANLEKAREYLWRLADVYDRMACFPHAEAQLRELLDLDLSKEQRLEALCFLADIQVGPGCMSAFPCCSPVSGAQYAYKLSVTR